MIVQNSFQSKDVNGTLYLVATPIGNLEDMTIRAVRILKEVDWIAAEDTRHSRKLLTHFDISAKLISYHEHNKNTRGAELVRRMAEGESIALISDAGLPTISDPGYELVKLAIENELAVVPIPGANAALSALIASGLPTQKFLFVGFLPRDNKGLQQELERLRNIRETIIIYESPRRVEKTLTSIYTIWGDRRMALARELTKKYEQFLRGTIEQCIQHLKDLPPLGECCIVVEGNLSNDQETDKTDIWWSNLSVTQHVDHYIMLDRKLLPKEAIKLVAENRGKPRREIYNQYVSEKNKKNPQ